MAVMVLTNSLFDLSCLKFTVSDTTSGLKKHWFKVKFMGLEGCFLSNEALLFSKMGIYLCSKILVPESGPDEPACRVGVETRL